MGRPRGFDEQAVTAAAAALFATRPYDGLSIDDLVQHLGVHRNSLYKTFGSKRGLYLAALRWYVQNDLGPLTERFAAQEDPFNAVAGADATWDLLILAAAEQAPIDAEVGALVQDVLQRLDATWPADSLPVAGVSPSMLSALLLGTRLRARAATEGISPAEPAP